MKKIYKNTKRIITIVLATVLFVTSIPTYAYGAELTEPDILKEDVMAGLTTDNLLDNNANDLPDDNADNIETSDIPDIIVPENGIGNETSTEEKTLFDIDVSAAPYDEVIESGIPDDTVMKGGYIEMPWDNNAPAVDDDMTWSEAIEGIVDDVQDDVWIPENVGYVSEPETVQSRFPDYNDEKDILKYLTDTYPVTRSQNPYGTCWAHSAVALTEFYMLKKGLKDSYGGVVDKNVNYSELQLAYFCYHNSPNPLYDTGDSVTFKNGNETFLDFGGNLGFAAQSMIRYSGITDEEEGSTAYSNAANVLQNGLADTYAHDHDQAYLKNEYEVNLKSNPKLAKQVILENGIIGTSFYWDSKYLANDGKSFYNGTENKTNHAVAIVGWDDNYSRTNFKTDPGENGAWLIRNSWTTYPAISSSSYFWLSYKDTSLNSTAYVYEMADRDRGEVYDNNYYFDSQLHDICTVPSGKVANVFTSQKTSEELKAVSLDITLPNSSAVDYIIKIYKGLVDTANPESGTLMDTVTGTLPFAGRYTIPLNETVSLTQGECFSVVVDTGSDRIDRECDYLWKNQVNMDTNINSGESFYYEGGSWKDMILKSSGGNYGNACIRALTNNTTSDLPENIVSISTEVITSDSVKLKWSAARDADSYQILRASGNGEYAVISTVSAGVRKYEDTGLTALTDYKYKVCPVRNGVTSWDDASPELTVKTKPGIPELTITNVGGYTAMVTWTEVKGCDGYKIRWGLSGYDGYTYSLTNETEYRIRNLTPESEYTVEVYPYTESGSSLNYSSPGNAVFSTGTGNPVPVGNLRAEPYNTDYIRLSWEVPDDVSAILVEQSEDNGNNYSLLGRYSYRTKSYYVNNLNNTTKYTFRITAVYTEDNAENPVIKAVSAPVSAYVKLPGVGNLKVTSSFEDKSMTVTWSGVANAAYYAVYRKMSSESEYIPLGIVPAGGELSYKDTAIVPGRYYYYRVFGCRENILTDEQGTVIAGYGNRIELDPVENVNTAVRSTSASVTWDPVSGADSYVIEQYQNNNWNEYTTILGGQTNEAALTGLSPKTYYRFRMFAKSEDGAVSVEQIGEKLYYAYTYFNFTTTDDDRESLSKSDFSFVSSSYTYDGQPHSAGITTDIEEVAAAGLTFAYAPVTNGTAGSFTGSVPVNAGTWQIKIQTPQTGNYKAATLTDPEWRFTINRAPLTVTANACTITYGEAPKGNGVSYSGFAGSDTAGDLGGTIKYDFDYTRYGSIGSSYTITPGGLTSDNYDITYQSGTLTVKAKEVTVSAQDSVDVQYDGNEKTGSASYTFSGLVSGHTGSIAYIPAKGTITGTYTGSFGDDLKVMNGSTDVTSNYVLKAKTPGRLKIVNRTDKYRITVEANSLSAEYDGTRKSVSGFKTLSFTVNGHDYTVNGLTTSAPESKDVCELSNSVEGTAVVTDDNGNDVTAQFIVTKKNGTLRIMKKVLTVTAKPGTVTYGDAPANNGVSYEGFAGADTAGVLGGTLTFSYDYKKYDDAGGSYKITPGGLVSDNYEIRYVPGKLTVDKKEVGLNWSSAPLIYNGMSQVPSVTVTGLVNNDPVSATVTGAEINAGSGYTAVADALTGVKADNYKLPSANTHTFAIGRAVYNGTKTTFDFVRSGQVTTNALLGLPDLPEGASYAASGTVAGTNALILSHSVSGTYLTYSTADQPDNTSATITIGVNGALNYEDYSVVVTITAKAKDEALVTLNGGNDKRVTYGASDFTLIAQAKNEGENAVWTWSSSDNDVASVEEHTGKISVGKSGTASITVRYESDSTIGSAVITLTVDKKPLTVKWRDTYFVFDGSVHKPSIELNNLESGDICTVSVSGQQVNSGKYTAIASISGKNSGNYVLSDNDSKCDFTIAKAGMSGAVITLGQGLVYNGIEQTQAVAKVMVNGLVLASTDYFVKDNKGINAGQYTLTVTAAADTNYTGTVSKQFAIEKKIIVPVVSVTGTYSYTGDAVVPSYSVKDGETILAQSDYSAVVTDNVKAGQGMITVTETVGGNYSFGEVKQSFDISKATHGRERVSVEVEFGTGVSEELGRAIAAGGSLGSPTVISGQDVFDEMPSVSGTVLNFTIKGDNGLVGSDAVVEIPVNGADNYLDYIIEVKLKVIFNEIYSDLIKELRKDEENSNIQVSSNTVRNSNGSTDTTVTVGGKDVSRVTVGADGRVEERSNIWISGLKSSYHYTGAPIKPEISVYDGTKKLTLGTDYSLSYKNNKKVGKSSMLILSFKGNYALTEKQVLTFEILPAVIGKDVIIEDMTITGNKKLQKPVPMIIMKTTGRKLSKGNFGFIYKNKDGDVVNGIMDAGEYTVTVTSANASYVNDATEAVAKITVKDKSYLISRATVKLKQDAPKGFVYTGAAISPGPGRYILTIKNGREEIILKEDKDYSVEYSNNVNPGNALVTFVGMGSYSGIKKTTFKIEKGRALNDNKDITITFADGVTSVPYAKGGAKPEIVVKDSGTVLVPDRDYKVSYSNNTAVTNGATAMVKIKGKGNYKGEVTRGFTIVRQDINNLKEGIFVTDKIRTNKKNGYRNPVITVTDLNGKKLKEKTDYMIVGDYTEPDEQGYVTVSIKAVDTGNYKGTIKVTYRYLNVNNMLSKVKVMKNIDTQTYTGNEIILSEDDLKDILYTGKKATPVYLIPGTDFEVLSYTNNRKKGTAKIILKGIGTYGGTKTLQFKIKAKKGIYTGAIRDGSW